MLPDLSDDQLISLSQQHGLTLVSPAGPLPTTQITPARATLNEGMEWPMDRGDSSNDVSTIKQRDVDLTYLLWSDQACRSLQVLNTLPTQCHIKSYHTHLEACLIP